MLERLHIPSGLGTLHDPSERKTDGLLGCLASPDGAVFHGLGVGFNSN